MNNKGVKKFAVILSGCGVYDGSEIHEAVMALYAIKFYGHDYRCFAPDMTIDTINHITGNPDGTKRNVLHESARIARGDIASLSEFNADEFDALVLPGGFGAAKNLSDYAVKGVDLNVRNDVKEAVLSMKKANKPIGAMCIAPVIIAKLIPNVTLTIGTDNVTAGNIEKIGAIHSNTNLGEVYVDDTNKVVTTGCYMLDANIADIAESAKKMVENIIKFIA